MPLSASRRRFVFALILIALSGLALRASYVVFETHEPDTELYDSVYYRLSAVEVAEGNGFRDPDRGGPWAQHPPMTTLFLAPVAWLWGPSDFAMGLAMAALGTLNVVLIGLLGLRMRSPRCGLIAAAVAVVYPSLWANDGLVMSETLTVTWVVLSLLTTFRLLERWRPADAVLLGVLCGFAALTRGELALLLPMLIAGSLLQRAGPRRPRRAALATFAALASLLVVMPWVTYNLVRFPEPVLISTNLDIALWSSSCDEVYYGPSTGLGTFCPDFEAGEKNKEEKFRRFLRITPQQQLRERRETALDYIGEHLDRYPVVVLARAARTWSAFRPFDMLEYDVLEGRPRWVNQASLAFYYPLVGLAIWGLFLARGRVQVWPLLVPPIIATLAAFVALGLPRYRVIAEPGIVVLAAIALDTLVGRIKERTTGVGAPQTTSQTEPDSMRARRSPGLLRSCAAAS
ncbi:MAG: hypothetical protein FJW88_08580 [Actinobacteria bacterium]|nr:hypothetical protein [Actinomycetota bacterium]